MKDKKTDPLLSRPNAHPQLTLEFGNEEKKQIMRVYTEPLPV